MFLRVIFGFNFLRNRRAQQNNKIVASFLVDLHAFSCRSILLSYKTFGNCMRDMFMYKIIYALSNIFSDIRSNTIIAEKCISALICLILCAGVHA